MPRIIEYPETPTPNDDEMLLIDGEEGNKKLSIGNLLKGIRNLFSNKTRRTRRNITGDLTNLSTAISEQNLEKYGYSIGDYFVGPSGYYYYLADMDTYYGDYDFCAVLSTHHIAIVVDTKTTSKWYSSDATSVGYNGSTLHSYLKGTVLNNIKSDMIALFGGTTGLEHLLSHQKLLTTSNAAWGWQTDQYISAITEVEVYGSTILSLNGYQQGESFKKLALFDKFRVNGIFGKTHVWLRNSQSSTSACIVTNSGGANYTVASAACEAVGIILFK